jgi:hypothetical protein
MKNFLIILFCIISSYAIGQSPDSTNSVTINVDERIHEVITKPAAATSSKGTGFIGKIKGYRIQIYNGNDRNKANTAKQNFAKNHPGTRTYLTYSNPQFRVRVGDFTSRKEAQELYKKLSSSFNPCMIVPDVINVNNIKKTASSTAE